uniref:ATP synthase complex subunit 8 n=1 Tax=Hydrolycus scomberoides TaxID=642551 RepID=F7UIN5_HYDSO|nr:ATP synthase F0 subunit 8 [Hydrolycus scomberoides]BAK42099.1 ATPase subunit 8 [Hydrolycus scomberoides]
MPQLNPAPWFAILVFTWLIFLFILPPKVMKHTFTNDPAVLDTEKSKKEAWNWPWH